MKSIVQTDSEEVVVEDRDKPDIGNDEVLVRVHAAGVCGSDAHAYLYHGGYEWVELPRIMGHEYSGSVVDVGDSVTAFERGDPVVEEPTQTCGRCFQCKNDQSNICQEFSVKGMHRNGAYAEYTVARPEDLHHVPESVPLEHAVITEPLSVAARTVLDRSGLTAGDTVLVEGPGPIGTLVAVVADAIEGDVLVSGLERDESHRLPLLEKFGIDTVNLEDVALDDVTDEFTDGTGFDVVFDATGHHSGIETAVDQVRKGGEIVVVGLPGEESSIPLSSLVRDEVTVDTSYGSNWTDFERALNLLEREVIAVDEFIDTSPSLADPDAAFRAFLESESCKPVFQFAE